jgi:hypothetical protein
MLGVKVGSRKVPFFDMFRFLTAPSEDEACFRDLKAFGVLGLATVKGFLRLAKLIAGSL